MTLVDNYEVPQVDHDWQQCTLLCVPPNQAGVNQGNILELCDALSGHKRHLMSDAQVTTAARCILIMTLAWDVT